MKRIFAILMVCLFMVAVMAVMVVPAFAAPKCPGNPHCENPGGQPKGASQTFQNPSNR